jgi:uncharacterized Ntn-hydrolase superfamily protein
MMPALRRGFAVCTTIVLAFAAGTLFSASRSDTERQLGATAPAAATPDGTELVATFSIVGFDPDTGDLGIAVQSKFFAVGTVVPWARAGVGAVATQSFANTAFGPDGLQLLAAGETAEGVVAQLVESDDRKEMRQLGIVDAQGRAATFTGESCLPWAGGRTGEYYAVQGNILAGPGVVDAMADTFETTTGDLGSRLVAALAAGQAAGGDARGRQSAALVVVREEGGYGGRNDRYIDLRVDDNAAPIRELQRLLHVRLAQIETGNAGRALRAGDHDLALSSARSALEYHPEDGATWLMLARVHVARGELADAGEAGRQSLLRDPWLKSAALRGLVDKGLIERLLEVDVFARLWESIEAEL